MVKSTSQFGVGIDTVNQVSEAIEGTGTLTLTNDQDFWLKNFDQVTFDNQNCLLYSYNRALALSEIKLLFKGNVLSRSYTTTTITFQLQDLFALLRAPFNLPLIGALNARTDANLNKAYQRMVLGRVFGHKPTNIDQVLTGYPITGTIAVTFNDPSIVGTGTIFLTEFSPNDSIIINGLKYTIQTVDSDTGMTLTQPFTDLTIVSTVAIVPDKPKRYINRIFQVAGHAVREPVATITGSSTIIKLRVNTTEDFYVGDTIYIGTIGSGELAKIASIVGSNYIVLTQTLTTVPVVGSTITRPALQNVRIASTMLQYFRDYTFNASTGILTLRKTAEANAAAVLSFTDTIAFTGGVRVITGTNFNATFQAGYMVGMVGHLDFFEILSVDSDTQMTLRTPATFTDAGIGRYKSLIYDPANNVLSVDTLGLTDNGTSTGVLLKKVPGLNKFLLTQAGLGPELNTDSFDQMDKIAYQNIGLVIPAKFDDITIPILRDVLSQINKSIFGYLVQNDSFKFTYRVLRPNKTVAVKLTEADVLSFTLSSSSQNMASSVTVQYRPQEYNHLVDNSSIEVANKVSNAGQFVLKTANALIVTSILVEPSNAQAYANRWALILDQSTGILDVTTKMQGYLLEIGDIVEIEHRKLYERFGPGSKSKLMLVQSVKRSGVDVTISGTDLSNTFNRIANICDFATNWDSSLDDQRLVGGYMTDQYGLISNDPKTFGVNLIW
jgi:hypothetical protein